MRKLKKRKHKRIPKTLPKPSLAADIGESGSDLKKPDDFRKFRRPPGRETMSPQADQGSASSSPRFQAMQAEFRD